MIFIFFLVREHISTFFSTVPGCFGLSAAMCWHQWRCLVLWFPHRGLLNVPDTPLQVQPRCRAAPTPPAAHAWGERSRKEPIAPAVRALSERCTQFRERILFLGPPICQEQRKNEGNVDAEEARERLRTFGAVFVVYTLIRTSKHSHETWTCVSPCQPSCSLVCVRVHVCACMCVV